jgi:cytochrome c5
MLKRTTFLSLFFLALLAGCGKEEPKPTPAPEPAMPETAPMEAPAAPEAAMPEAAPMEEPAAPEAAMPEAAPMEEPAAPEAAMPEAAAPATVAIPADNGAAGKKVYDSICVACHAAGIAGAPKLGDKAAWGPRIEQGMDTLYAHSINGFQGKTGVMPPKGGNMALSDDEMKAAVDYMVAQAQ